MPQQNPSEKGQDPSEREKALAGAKAAEAVSPGMRLGLGTGSTVAFFLRALGRRVQGGELPGIVGVPTSQRTEREAGELGIPLSTLEEVGFLDLTVDGAEEVDPELDLIKGLGGALLREKMVAQATRHLIIIADQSKLVDRLGTRSPLPVEVVPFSWETHLAFFESLGVRAVLREIRDGQHQGNLLVVVPLFLKTGKLIKLSLLKKMKVTGMLVQFLLKKFIFTQSNCT